MKKTVLCGMLTALIVTSAAITDSLCQSRQPPTLELPGDVRQMLPSPDGRWALIGTPLPDRELRLENQADKHQELVTGFSRSLSAAWSPDSKAFFVNDAYGSNLEDTYVYWLGSKEPHKLNDLILTHYKWDTEVDADHAYFQAVRWLGPAKLLVEYCGHGHGGLHQFDFVYVITLANSAGQESKTRRVSREIRPADLSKSDCKY